MKKLKRILYDYMKFIGLISFITGLEIIANSLANLI